MQASSLTSKPHLPILDGLRGVAALMVVAFHILEAHAADRFSQVINHGYLAVDFFFLLSGFVIGFAYDDRWNQMSLGAFIRRRLIRLQPMLVMGMLVGALFFYTQDSVLWPGIHAVPVWQVMLTLLAGMLMIPLLTGMDIRGWWEMYPLNGPAWSLFFEYLANLMYALFIRKWPVWALALLVLVSGGALAHYSVTGSQGDLIGGWSLDPAQFRIGLTRLMYPFFAGLLLFRIARLRPVPNAFLWCSLLLMAALSVPRLGGEQGLWMNGLYDALMVILVFPLIVYLGAGGTLRANRETALCRFLGDISYPIYITHYPILYWYTGWVKDHNSSILSTWPVALGVMAGCILLAYACLRLYDVPVRRWLQARWK